jgi:hypothetical protein
MMTNEKYNTIGTIAKITVFVTFSFIINLEKRNFTLIKVKKPIIKDNILAKWMKKMLVDPKSKNGASSHERSGLQ